VINFKPSGNFYNEQKVMSRGVIIDKNSTTKNSDHIRAATQHMRHPDKNSNQNLVTARSIDSKVAARQSGTQHHGQTFQSKPTQELINTSDDGLNQINAPNSMEQNVDKILNRQRSSPNSNRIINKDQSPERFMDIHRPDANKSAIKTERLSEIGPSG
jgi:hypothetical protein